MVEPIYELDGLLALSQHSLLQEPDLRRGRNILLYQIAGQHDRHSARAAIWD